MPAPAAMRDTPPTNPAFLYRAGIRMAGTVVTCDGSAASDLLFLSHAPVLSAHRRGGLPRLGSGRRRQLLSTDATLTLLGPVGARLRPHALIAALGRPFALGDLRLELFSSDHLPGAASLLCEQAGRRLVYAGPTGDGADLRTADAVCVDARWAAADLELPDSAAARAALVDACRQGDGARRPVLLVDPPGLAPVVAQALAEAGLATRTHRKILEAFGVYRQALGGGPADGGRAAVLGATFADRGAAVAGRRARSRPGPEVRAAGHAAGGPSRDARVGAPAHGSGRRRGVPVRGGRPPADAIRGGDRRVAGGPGGGAG